MNNPKLKKRWSTGYEYSSNTMDFLLNKYISSYLTALAQQGYILSWNSHIFLFFYFLKELG